MTRSQLDTLIGAASSMRERLELGYRGEPSDPGERKNRWSKNAAQSSAAKLSERLRWDELDEAAADRLAGAASVTLTGPAPWWADLVEKLVSLAGEPAVADEPRAPDAPFVHAIVPFARFAFSLFEQRVDTGELDPGVRLTLEANLERKLAYLTDQTLAQEFRAAGCRYQPFIDGLLQGGWQPLLSRYPVLARLLAIRIAYWIGDICEFFEWLAADRAGIVSRFSEGRDPGRLIALKPSMSDPHHQGRSVKLAEFESGLKLLYKPKPLGLDAALSGLLDWFSSQPGAPRLKAPNVWARDGYGWVEFVPQAPCESEQELHDYYERAGALVAILYLLQGTDFHFENLIASGPWPVPVDLETLLTHEFKVPGQVGRAMRSTDSVLRSGLLPGWEISAGDGWSRDLSGIGGFDGLEHTRVETRWLDVNTDAMRTADRHVAMPMPGNIATLRGEEADPRKYLESVTAGFQKAYEIIAANRDELLAEGGAIRRFQGLPARLIFRPTSVYAKLLQRANHPWFLKDGLDRSIEFEALARHTLNSPRGHRDPEMFRAEVDCLEQLDVPLFDADTAEDAIRSEGRECGRGMLVEPSYDTVAQLVGRMSAADLTRQVALIRAAFEAKTAKPSQGEAIQRTEIRTAEREPAASELIEQARRIALELENTALRDLDGSVSWLGFDVVPGCDRFRLSPLGLSLYAGVSGVAVFLAALYRATGESRWERLARAAAATVRNQLTKNVDPDQARTHAAEEGIGGARGLASTVYAFTRTSAFLQDPGYLEDARKIALLLTAERIEADDKLDPMGGTAGAILGLLPLWEQIRDEEIMARMVECGHHLVRRQTAADGRAWHSLLPGRPALTGMSHGASGIAYALLRLHSVHPEPAFLEAALRGIDFETALFSRQARVWPDLRFAESDPSRFERTGSWCSGAPGIGLARMAAWKLRPVAALAQDVHHALAHVLERPLPATDTLCCGAFGVLELPLLATERLGREELLTIARRRAGAVIEEAAASGGFNLFGIESRAFHPGFHRGASGIGYQILRLADPAGLPSVLVWD